MKRYSQLTLGQRYQIAALLRAGFTQAAIAKEVCVHQSTISREVRRNRSPKVYRPRKANRKALDRRREKARTPFADPLWRLVKAWIRHDLSPEQISHRLRMEHQRGFSHEWIYQFIYADKRAGGDLHRHLRIQKMYRKRYGSRDRRGVIPGRTFIDQRPEIVDRKARIGDWEGDTVQGKGQRLVMVSLVERVSQYTLVSPVVHKTKQTVREQVRKLLKPYRDRVLTLTLDNGREFADHPGMAKDLQAAIYFAHPRASWERGLNEQVNGLLRQYIPKGTDLSEVDAEQIARAVHRLNHRPRRTLGYRTPYEVFFNTTTNLTYALGS